MATTSASKAASRANVALTEFGTLMLEIVKHGPASSSYSAT